MPEENQSVEIDQEEFSSIKVLHYYNEYEVFESMMGIFVVAMLFGRLLSQCSQIELKFAKRQLAILLVAFSLKYMQARIGALYRNYDFDPLYYSDERNDHVREHYETNYLISNSLYIGTVTAANLMFAYKFWTSSKSMYKRFRANQNGNADGGQKEAISRR